MSDPNWLQPLFAVRCLAVAMAEVWVALLFGLSPAVADTPPVVTLTRLHSFGDPTQDANRSRSQVIEGSDGLLYGTTERFASGFGAVFRVNPDGTGFQVLKSFNYSSDGAYPYAGVTEGSDGALYGTAYAGGSSGRGTVYRLNKDGTGFQVLQMLSGAGGAPGHPRGQLIFGTDGHLYGTSSEGGDAYSGTVFVMEILSGHNPPITVAGDDQVVDAGADCLATVTVDGSGSSDPDGDALSYRWELFEDVESLDTVLDEALVSWNLPIGTYEAVLTVSTEKEGVIVSTSGSLTIQVLPSAPTLVSMSPAAAYANGPAFDLVITGGCFLEGATVYWSGAPRPTTVSSGSEVVAAIPASDLETSVDIAVATVYVVNGDGQVSNPLGFSIVAQTVGTVDGAVSEPGETTTVSTAPTTVGEPGVTVSVTNDSDEPVTVLAATYDEMPVGETAFRVDNGSFVDVQMIGATEDVSATVLFYYPSDVTGGMENRTKLRYFDGTDWIRVLSSGGLPPAKDITDDLDGTISGGRFTVIFDMTSTPTIIELAGTVFGMFESLPQIDTISGPTGPVALGNPVTLTVDFVALGEQTAVAVNFLWNDGTETDVFPEVEGSASASHLYAAPGVYGVTVQVMDGEGDMREGRFEYVVIYDPDGGFVTGGGWIDSPAGAYVFDPTLAGKATFGFVSKYKKGQSVPTGETQFQFHAGDFKFHSTAYEWLVVSGAKAQYKGVGKVNGAGDYGFLLTATDGQIAGGGGTDKFRIKIWDRVGELGVYDNVLDESDDLDAAKPQVIGGGSIVIHQSK